MLRSAFSTLRVRLLLLVLLAIVPSLGVMLYTGLEQRRLTAIDVKEEALRLVRLTSANQERLIEGTRQLLIVLAKLPAVQNRHKTLCSALFANLLEHHPQFANVAAVGLDGIVFSSGVPFSSPVQAADRVWFQRALKTRDFAIGEYQIGRITGKPTINFGYPALDPKGVVKAVVFAALDLAWMNQFAADARLPHGATLTVVDRNGTILVRHPDPDKWYGKSLPESSFIQTILNKGEGTAEVPGVDGITRLYAFAPLGDVTAGAYVSIGIPKKDAIAPSNQVFNQSLLVLGLAGVLALVAAWFMGDVLILRRVKALLGVAKRLTNGDLSARTGLAYGVGELGQLSFAFDRMAEFLERREQERKRVETALRESEERFRDLYDNAPLGYHEYDAEGRITRVNRTDLEMMGYTAEEMIGQPMWKFNTDEEIAREQILAKLAGVLSPGKNLERTYKRKDGATFPVLIEDRLILDEKGQIKGIRCTIQDITERNRAEEEMAALQAQLRQSQKMEAIGRLAGGIAHDFNNLLTVIRGYSQLALTGLKTDNPLRGNIEQIEKASERAADLTRQLLAFSRRQVMELKVLDLRGVLQNLEKMLRRVIGEDIELIMELADVTGMVKVDPGQMEQVILNLAVNAKDAMPDGGNLIIEITNAELDEEYARKHVAIKPGQYVMLSVSDNGCGMSPEIRDRIFEPFFTTKEKAKGTGLGLSTVYGIVKQSGGNIWVYSEPGHGTTFKIYLPRVDEPEDKLEPKEAGEEPSCGDETILLVEDDDEVRKLAVEILQRQEYKVLEASHSGEASILCDQHVGKIHLMLTDVVLPVMSGRKLAENLVSLHPEMKVLYMSGYTDNAISHHGVLEKGLNYIQKPFTVSGLLRKVREVLGKNSGQIS